MPRFGLLNPHDQDPERAQLVQQYMSYMAQQTSVQRRLSSPSPASPLSSGGSSPESSPIYFDGDEAPTTPVRRRSSNNYSPSQSPRPRPTRSPSLRQPSVPSIPELPESEQRIDNDQDKLAAINMKIKATLTDLLNCESVKHDARMRSWVQTRLMDAQHSLNDRRREAVSTTNHRRVSNSAFHSWTFPQSVRVDQLIQGESVRKLSI